MQIKNIQCEERDGLLHVFNFDNQAVRNVIIDSEPWWVLADICKVLRLASNPTIISKRFAEEDVRRIAMPQIHNKSMVVVICISTKCLTELVKANESRKLCAVKFREWFLNGCNDVDERYDYIKKRLNNLLKVEDELIGEYNKLVDSFHDIDKNLAAYKTRLAAYGKVLEEYKKEVVKSENLEKKKDFNNTYDPNPVKIQMIS